MATKAIDMVERLFAILRDRISDGVVEACAIAREERHDGRITIMLRAPNYSADIAAPFSEEGKGFLGLKRRLSLGEFTARMAANELFGERR